MKLSRIAVFCGSSSGNHPAYREQAIALADELCARSIGLVYGGASVGLMGAIADRVMAKGGEVIGVIPEAVVKLEVAHKSLTQLHVVDTMHERKAKMADLADAFIAMPGGLGTLDELFEIATWALLDIHHKPIGLLNVKHFYDPLLAHLDHAVHEGFIRPQHRALIQCEADGKTLVDRLSRN